MTISARDWKIAIAVGGYHASKLHVMRALKSAWRQFKILKKIDVENIQLDQLVVFREAVAALNGFISAYDHAIASTVELQKVADYERETEETTKLPGKKI